VFEALEYLIDHLPENMRLVIATRYDPPLPLSRLRARGKLTEIRSAKLRFSREEVAAFFNKQLRFDLAPESIADLEVRTEGWAAVLCLLAASLDHVSTANERVAYVKKLPLSEQHIFDFLAEEILKKQKPNQRKFLLETSMLPELSIDLCQAVTGQQDAAETLDELYRNNLIQIVVSRAVDQYAPSYRYHDLLAAFFYLQLEREYTTDEIQQLHRRAAESQPGTSFSIHHYLKAELWGEAAQDIQQIGQQMIYMGLSDTLNNWIAALPQQSIDQYPQLNYFLGVAAYQRGDFEKAQKLVTHALTGFEAAGDEAKKGAAILILGAIASGFHDVELGGSLLDQALSFSLAPPLKVLAHISRAWVGVYSNDWELVEKSVTTAIQLALKLEEPSAFNVLAPQLTSVLLFMPNGVKHLKEYCTQVLAWVGDDIGLIQLSANALMGTIHLFEGNLDVGRQTLEHAKIASGQLGGFVWLDISIDGGILHHALMRAEYGKFEQYWQSRLSHYEQVDGAREYLTSYLFIRGRALYCQNRINEAGEIYARMLEIEQLGDTPESRLVRALMGAMLMISERQYPQAEGILRQVTVQQKNAPHSFLFGNAGALLAALYLAWDQPEAALTELRKIITEHEQRDMLGLLLTDGVVLTPVLKLAVEKGVCLDQSTWLLEILESDQGFRPVEIAATGKTLTKREVEVLNLITEGMKNNQIAESLVIGETTVKSHITSIFRKLGVKTRTQAAAQARTLNLF
jgi:LuxR family maltose regulon positive regulatory protein